MEQSIFRRFIAIVDLPKIPRCFCYCVYDSQAK